MDDQAFKLLIEKLRDVDEKINCVEDKVDEILRFKWQVIGGSVFLSILLTAVINITAIIVR